MQPLNTYRRELHSDFDASARNDFSILRQYAHQIRTRTSPFEKTNWKTLQALTYMIEQTSAIESLLEGFDVPSLQRCPMEKRMALCGYLKSIGEKTRSIEWQYKEIHTEVPWDDLFQIRNELAHDMIFMAKGEQWNGMAHFFIEEFPTLKIYLEEIAAVLKLEAELLDNKLSDKCPYQIS